MNGLYKSGVIQRAIERSLGLAVAFDNDGQIDLLLFGTNAHPLPAVTLDEIEGYVERVILARGTKSGKPRTTRRRCGCC